MNDSVKQDDINQLEKILNEIFSSCDRFLQFHNDGKIYVNNCDEIISDLETNLIASKFHKSQIRFGNTYSSCDLWNFLSWLVNYSFHNSIPEALNNLLHFVIENKMPTLKIILLQGLIVDRPWNITDELILLPINQVPSQEFQYAYALREINHQSSRSTTKAPWEDFLSVNLYPRAALVRRYSIPNAISKYKFDDDDVCILRNDSEYYDIKHDWIYFAAKYITLAGPSGIVAVAEWDEPEDWAPLKGYLGGVWKNFPLEHLNYKVIEPSSEEIEIMIESFQLFISAPEYLKKWLQVPLQRLNAAVRRNNDTDRAIDLGIAMEAVLLSDRESKDSLALPFRLRGAFFLAKDDIKKRKSMERLLNIIYTLRSIAVHTGEVPVKYKLQGEERLTSDILTEGMKICSKLIFDIVRLGRKPDWSSIMLGGDA